MRNLIYIFLTLAFLAAGCSNEGDNPDFQEEIAVFGYLFVGEAINPDNAIYISKTTPLEVEFEPNTTGVISDAFVTLQKEGSTDPVVLDEVPDHPGHYYNSNIIIEAQTRYDLYIEAEGKTITSQTLTPYPMEVVEEPIGIPASLIYYDNGELCPTDTIPDSMTMVYDNIPDYHRVAFTCPDPSEEQICMVDVYCLEKVRDARYIYVLNDHDRPDDSDEYEGNGNDEPRHISGLLRLKHFDQEGDNYIFDWYGGMIVFWGRYELGFYTIDENYYNFLYREYPERKSGIEGGIGVFGSASRSTYYVKIVED